MSEPQVLVRFPGEHLEWHHRVLLHRIEGGRWVCLTPDNELVLYDLNDMQHRLLMRNRPFPADLLEKLYVFDPVDSASLRAAKRDAQLQASILGPDQPTDQAAMVWVVADPRDALFGQEIPAEILEDEEAAQLLAEKGVVMLDSAERYVALVDKEGLQGCVASRQSTEGDRRVLDPAHVQKYRGGAGTSDEKFLEFRAAVSAMQPEAEPGPWYFDGPRAAAEFLTQVREGAGSVTSYHAEWIRLSGVHEGGAQAHKHRSLCELVRLACCVDMLDCTNLACMEHAIRRLVALELAVERNPRHPDYSGLDAVEGGVVSSRGAAKMAVFREHVALRQREKASIMKQERLFREEKDKRAKVESGGGGGGAGSSRDGGRGRGGGRGKKGGGADGGAAADG